MGSKTQTSQTVLKALKLLVIVADEGATRGISLATLADRADFHRTTVYRYLVTLGKAGFVRQDPDTRLYKLGIKALELGSRFLEGLELRDIALPLLRELMTKTGETAHLGIMDGNDVIYVEKVESNRALRLSSRIGARVPAHCTALGKAMWAYLPEDRLNAILSNGLPARTATTITSPTAFKEVLTEVRNLGYSVDNMENEEGVRCIAAPIFDYTKRVMGAISISGPVMRVTEEAIPEMGSLVKEAAYRISQQIGAYLSSIF